MLKCYIVVVFYLLALSEAKAIEELSNADKNKVAGSTTYDQRQTGKYNVHVNIKDVQFFSLSDSLGTIGDYSDYGGGDYDLIGGDFGDTDTDYDVSHLTVNPIFAFLGSHKPTTLKPATISTTEKAELLSSTTAAPTTVAPQESTASPIKEATTTSKQDSPESEIKDPAAPIIKPAAMEEKKSQLVNDTIDYEEVPVEVQYYRTNPQKLPSNGRREAMPMRHFKRQPSVQIIDGHGRTNNVKIMENDQHIVKICNRGEFRDNLGRCRVRTRRGAGVPGL